MPIHSDSRGPATPGRPTGLRSLVSPGVRLRRLLGIDRREATWARRGFDDCPASVRSRLEAVGGAFVDGYECALWSGEVSDLAAALEAIDPERRGFAYEGAAMGLAILDLVLPGGARRVRRLLDGPGAPHRYLVHVGVGWALARCRWRWSRALAQLDPALRWLAFDGQGFHEGYFLASRTVGRHQRPRRLTGYERRAFDQGLGRSLWFVGGAEPDRIASRIREFPPERHPDLWSGVGLASAYAGGGDESALHALRLRSGAHRYHLAQGCVFAAEARAEAGNPAPHTEAACRVLCDLTVAESTLLCQEARERLRSASDGTPEFPYEGWRAAVRASLRARSS